MAADRDSVPRQSESADLAWTDHDGDRVVISDSRDAIGSEPVVGSIQVFSGETGAESAVYIETNANARALIAWLTARLEGGA